jgi:anti-sigma regulatory factor (Ser/Thr protein kinase)
MKPAIPAMPTVHLAFSPDAAYVRTVRLVAAAAARRAGVSDELLDEVRLAIGEACTRAVAMHRRYGLPDLITVAMSDGGRFTVSVTDRSPVESALREPGETTKRIMAEVAIATGRSPIDEEAITEDVGLALLTALVADLKVAADADGSGTEIRMSWPVGRRSSA